MKVTKPVILILVVIWASACIAIPFPADEVTSGHEISEEEVLFIESGVTTRQQVLERLGDPSVIWEDERVVAYNWEHVGWRMAIVAAAGGTGVGGVLDVTTPHALVIQFDEADRVKKFERTTIPPLSYGPFLREWVGQK